MDLLKDFNFLMIYIIHKMKVLLKNYLNYLKDDIFEFLFNYYNRLLVFKKNIFFSFYITMENLRFEDEKIIKDIRKLFRLKKEFIGIKDIVLRIIKNLFEYEKVEEKGYQPVRVNALWSNNYINTKVMVIKIKCYQLKNILMKLDHI